MPDLITESLYHRTLNGFELLRRREAAGMTQAEFAELCEWSPQYQSQLEDIGQHEITVIAAEKILHVFAEIK